MSDLGPDTIHSDVVRVSDGEAESNSSMLLLRAAVVWVG